MIEMPCAALPGRKPGRGAFSILLRLAAVLLPLGASHAASILWTNTAGGNWSAAVNWSPNRVPGTADDATLSPGSYAVTNDITTNVNSLTIPNSSVTFTVAGGTVFSTLGALSFPGGTINVAGSINCGGLNFTGGTINGPGAINLSGSNSWGGGVFQSTSPGTLTLLSGAVLNINGDADHDLPGWIFNNSGTNLHTGGRVRGGTGTLINNTGLWLEQVDLAINADYGGVWTFLNAGTFEKTNTTGTTTFNGNVLLNNSGLVDVEGGNINIAGGGTNSGTFNAATNTYNDFTAPYTFNNDSTFTGTGIDYWDASPITLNGTMISTSAANLQWNTGAITGTLTIPNGSTLNIVGGNNHFQNGCTLTNNGTVVDNSGSYIRGNGWTIYNNGLWLEGANSTLYYDGGTDTIVNSGTFRKAGSTGTTTISSGVGFNNSGLVDTESGDIQFNGGGTNSGTFSAATNAYNDFTASYTFNNGSTFAGNGINYWDANTITLNGTLISTNAANLRWNSGAITGTLTIPNGSTLNIVNGISHFQNGCILTNNGTVIDTSGSYIRGNGWTIYNNGLWLEEADSIFYYDGGTDTIVNSGTFRKAGSTGTTTISSGVGFNNTGLVDTESGDIQFNGGGANSGTFNAATNAYNDFTASYIFNNGSTFAGNGINYWDANTITLNGTLISTNAANLRWNSGAITGTLTITNGSTLNIVNATSHYLSGGILTNNGTVIDTSGSYIRGTTWTIYNNALWLEEADSIFYGDGGADTFVNSGTFRKTANPSGTTYFQNGVVLNNSGLVDAQSGTIAIQSGGTGSGTFNAAAGANNNFTANYAFNGGTLFTGAGLQYLSGGAITFNGNSTVSNLFLEGATLGGTGVLTLLGTNTFYSGILGGIETVPGGSTLNIVSGNGHYLSGGILTNNGTVIDTSGNYIRGTTWTIYNNGLWLEEADSAFYGDGGADTFVNSGTFRKTANPSGTTYFLNGVVLNNSGLVDAQSGTIAIQSGGTSSGTFNAAAGADNNFTANYTFNAGTLFTGAGLQHLSGGAITFNGNSTVSNLFLEGATLGGTGVLTLLGTNTFYSGILGGIETVPGGSTLNIVSGNGHYLSGGILTNNGTVIDTSGNYIRGTTWTIYNNGLWLAEADSAFYGDGGADTFVNSGTFRKTANPSGTTYFQNGVVLNNSGLMDAQSGTIAIQSGGTSSGTFNAAAGADNNFTANYTFNNGSGFTGLGINYLDGGTATFNGSIISSNLEWYSGVIAGTLIISYGSTFYIVPPSGTHDLPGATLQNYGTVIHTGGRIRQGWGGLIDNEGLWLEQIDTDFNDTDYGGATSTFLNNGTFNKNSTAGATTFDGGFPFNNNGTLEVLSGAVTFNGPYNPSSPTLLFGVSNLTSYGSVNISGATTLGGTLGLQLLNGFVPAVSNVITPLTYGSRSGVFSAFNFPVLPSGENWTPGYGNVSLSLTVTGLGSNDTLSISGTVTNLQGNPIVGANVFAVIDPASFTNLVQNGDFETPSVNGAQYVLYGIGSTAITGWTVFGPANDNVALVGPAAGLAAQSGVQFFDPTGGTGGAGITQTFPTVSNQSYVMSFYQGTESQHGTANALGVTIGTNFFFFPETSGNSGNLDWTERRIAFTAISNFTTLSFQDDTGANSDNSYVDNVVVGPPDYGVVLGAVTDSNGHYQIAVGSGTFQVGVNGLSVLGYNPVANQEVAITNSNGTANFAAAPFSGQLFTVSVTVSPAGSGAIAGGGTFPQNSTVTVTATPVSVPPYVFVNWTENGYFQSASSNYSFTLTRNRQLVANFTLPLYSLAASNNPPGAGTVAGTGSYFYGTTNVLTATPNFGYAFSNWTVGGVVVGASPSLSVGSYSNVLIVANYGAANLSHTITTATSPPGLALVTGAGVYSNGQTATFTAPLEVTNPPNYYYFSQFTLSNTVASASAAFAKTFSTLDPTNLQYVAVYTAQTIVPQIRNVTPNFASPVPATTNFILALQFDRTMQTSVTPVLLLTNSATGALQPVVPGTGGSWTGTVLANDTYHTPPITIAPGMDGTIQLYVSGAQDLNGDVLPLTNAAAFVVVATPPPNPVLSLSSSNSSSAVVSWAGYTTPPNLSGFRVFIESTNFTSVTGLPVLTGLGSGANSFQFSGLSLDTAYYAAVEAYDVAGNASTNVTALRIFLPSAIPPAVAIQQIPVGDAAASLSWSSYNTAGLFGFSGFYVYYGTANFTTVAGLVPAATLGPSANSFLVSGLNRANTYYFAVVGFNDTNGFNPNVTTATWTDPYSGNITASASIGGAGQSVVNIYRSMVVLNNATLTIQPGTTLLFAPGTSLTIQQGSLAANGTALAPIILDSAHDSAGNTPAAGDWGGVTLGSGAGSSSLNFVEIFYGGGLTVSGCSPTVNALTANNNAHYGLGLQNGATLATASALLTGNAVGAQQADTSVLTITNSVIQNNGTNALAGGTPPMAATLNWWGSPAQANITALLEGNVTCSPFLTYEPLLTPAVGAVGGVTQVGSATASLQLACRTADSMRLSEDFTFTGVFFVPFTNDASFPFSPGGGLKHIYAQFRSITGATNAPVELDLTYITTGPVIQSFSLSQDQTLNRPLTVTGSATAVLGMEDMEFYVDGVLQSTNAGGSFSQFFDIRTLPNAIHQVELLARDLSGNIATLTYDVVIALTPPLAPVITVPAADILTNTDYVTVSGTAEPAMKIQLARNGQIVGVTNANSGGNFTISNAVLVEGVNSIIAIASDNTGTTPSAARHVTVETIPPAQLILNRAGLCARAGAWRSTGSSRATGKQAVAFQCILERRALRVRRPGGQPVSGAQHHDAHSQQPGQRDLVLWGGGLRRRWECQSAFGLGFLRLRLLAAIFEHQLWRAVPNRDWSFDGGSDFQQGAGDRAGADFEVLWRVFSHLDVADQRSPQYVANGV
jgi:hypothetical protein